MSRFAKKHHSKQTASFKAARSLRRICDALKGMELIAQARSTASRIANRASRHQHNQRTLRFA